tara:strand:+ start:64607 stop:65329 length:723 start_codon:yes stop_codon:yes gene_type:complete
MNIEGIDNKLLESYNKVFYQFKTEKKFDYKLLEESKEIFNIDYENNIATPKSLEVVAVLGGLQFHSEFQNIIKDIQKKINDITQDKLSYMVKGKNLGLELLVLKWPKDKRNISFELELRKFMNSIDFLPITIVFNGMQIHRDGCIVVRGFDVDNKFRDLRNLIMNTYPQLPRKQSQWVHVPIGRLLHQIDLNTFHKLYDFTISTQLDFNLIPTQVLNSLKLIYEVQWYMENRSLIQEWKT